MSEPRNDFASLPRVADLEPIQVRQRVVALLELLDQTVAEKDRLETIEQDSKAELEELQASAGWDGFRHGLLVFQSVPTKGRRTIDADKVQGLLLEYGYPPDQMSEIWKTGKPGTRSTFAKLPEGTDAK